MKNRANQPNSRLNNRANSSIEAQLQLWQNELMKKVCPILPPFLKIIVATLSVIIFFGLLKLLGFQLNWGQIVLAPASTITVTGEASQEQLNQIASFNAEIETIAEDKVTATDKTNQIMNDLIEELKAFGIKEEDLETSRIRVYQEDEYDELIPAVGIHPREVKKGDWRASNNLSITVRTEGDEMIADRAEAVLAILNQSEANYIAGPNFRLDNNDDSHELKLMELAVEDARQKAAAIATGNKQQVGKIINLTEGYSSNPRFYDYAPMGMGMDSAQEMVSAKLEPGSSEISQTVTVTFELK